MIKGLRPGPLHAQKKYGDAALQHPMPVRRLTLEQAVHALVEAPILDERRVHGVVVLKDVPRGLDSALQHRGVDDIEIQLLLLDLSSGAV